MNNEERKRYYFNQAEEEFKQIDYYWKKKNWNMVIRKAQESIEFLLKGTLKYMNIEFPKEHDVGKYFERILIERGIQYNKEDLKRIKILSEELTDKHAPAYYGEEFFSKEEAKIAKEGAIFIKEFIKKFLKSVKKYQIKN